MESEPSNVINEITAVEEVVIAWTAPEYEHKDRSARWYLTAGGVALCFLLFGIFAQSYFFIALVVLAFLVVLMYAKRAPRDIPFVITADGVHIGRSYHSFSQLTSFHIFRRQNELSLETKKHMHPFVRIPIAREIDPDDIKEILAEFIPEQEHPVFISDEIARRIGI